MADRESTLALVRDLAAAGVSKASFADSGALLQVEFFEGVPGLGLGGPPSSPEKPEPERQDPVSYAALRLSGQEPRR